jgi:hypothetical protein
MAIQRKVAGVNRIVALVLAFVWFGAGMVGMVVGFLYGRWLLAVIGFFALSYSFLWFRVVAHSRLLTWSELAAPWRTR